MVNEILDRYKLLSSSSERLQVGSVLTSIILAPPSTFNVSSRKDLIQAILDDLKTVGKSRLAYTDAAKALLAVKTLGREPAGSEVIGSPQNLSALLKFQSSLKDYPDAANEAIRCIANALLLVESARSEFLEPEVNGADICIPLLDKATTSDQIFILARVLFLACASGSSRIQELVENKHNGRYIVDVIPHKVDVLLPSAQTGAPMAREAMTDILKFAFYLLVHYPKLVETEPQHPHNQDDNKVMGDFWSSKLDGLLACSLKVFLALPAMSPCPLGAPMSHAIHALIVIPVTQSLKPVWFPQPSGRNSTSSTPKSPSAFTPRREFSQSSSRSQSPGRTSPTSPKPSTLDRAISVLTAGRKGLSRSRPSSPAVNNPMAVVDKALELLDATLGRYIPGKTEVDDSVVREKVTLDGQESLDDVASPLSLLITRLCDGDEAAKARVRQYIAPDDLDRSSPLEEREDLLGRCLRLLGSVYHSRLKDSVGEMLYAMCDANATTMSGLLGYGNVAGFLFNKGIMSAPGGDSNAPTTTASGEAINPITGTTSNPKPELPDMTDEEKEREMEKLLVLFDRLEKTGALPKEQNPIRKAIAEGKLPTS